MDTQPTTNIEIEQKSRFSTKNILLFLGGILLLVLLVGGGLALNSNRTNAPDDQEQATGQPQALAPYTIFYGSWESNESKVYAYDLSTGKQYQLATLPSDIKKVTVLGDKLLYIAHTNERDHGAALITRTIGSDTEDIIYTTEEGFGIDDYQVSPDKTYVATWEVKFAEDEPILLGGQSKVVTLNVKNPQTTHTIIREDAQENTPIHYPVALTNTGDVLMDTFLPNSGAGWAYGMSIADFQGTQVRNIESMQNGTYGTQPSISPDGTRLLFAGYDGSQGSGTELISGHRRSIIIPNTVGILEIASLERQTLTNLPQEGIFPAASWQDQDTVRITSASMNIEASGTLLYNLHTQDYQKVEYDEQDIVLATSREGTLVGSTGNLPDTIEGNLGPNYAQPLSALAFQPTGGERQALNLPAGVIQLIDVQENNTDFLSIQLSTVDEIVLPEVQQDGSQQNLQLQTFHFKPEMQEVRTRQQTEFPEYAKNESSRPPSTPINVVEPDQASAAKLPACKDYLAEQIKATCKWNDEKCGSPPPKPKKVDGKYVVEEDYTGKRVAYERCMKDQGKHPADACPGELQKAGAKAGKCSDSPLYLYGVAGTQVQATIHTPIFQSNAPHKNNKYTITLGKNGAMHIEDTTVYGIDYNYTPALRKIQPPKHGSIVKSSEVESTLRTYAQRLGLNTKETNDLVIKGKNSITAPYAFISFFDHDTSHAILPITFNPQPDVYRNIVFYFENYLTQPKYSVQPPVFEKIQRYGLTAIEVSVFTAH